MSSVRVEERQTVLTERLCSISSKDASIVDDPSITEQFRDPREHLEEVLQAYPDWHIAVTASGFRTLIIDPLNFRITWIQNKIFCGLTLWQNQLMAVFKRLPALYLRNGYSTSQSFLLVHPRDYGVTDMAFKERPEADKFLEKCSVLHNPFACTEKTERKIELSFRIKDIHFPLRLQIVSSDSTLGSEIILMTSLGAEIMHWYRQIVLNGNLRLEVTPQGVIAMDIYHIGLIFDHPLKTDMLQRMAIPNGQVSGLSQVPASLIDIH